MKVVFYDIEIFKNFYLVTFKYGEKRYIFEFSERSQLDVEKYLKFITWLSGKYVCGFNSISYDNLMINKSVELFTSNPNIDYLSFCKKMKDFSDLIIYGQNLQTLNWAKKQEKSIQLSLSFDLKELEEEVKQSKYNLSEIEWYECLKPYRYTHKWVDIDLLLFWSKGLRMTKQLSLKSIACQLNYPVIQELPLAHDSLVKLEDIENIVEYNSIHDIGVTELLFNNMKEDIDLRVDICNEYGLKAMSWDAPKIASEILLQAYCKEKFNDTSWETLKQVRNQKQEKVDFRVGDHLPKVNFKTDLFKQMYEVCCNSINVFSYSLLIPYKDNPLKLDYGVGGIHNSFENQTFVSDENRYVQTSDVASLYPTLIENLNVFRFPEVQKKYSEIKEYRLSVTKPTLGKFKKEKDKKNIEIWKIKDAFPKLLLNGVSGLLDSKYNWLYNNVPINILRIYGQMLLSRLVEECWINGIVGISCNTDGIELLLDKNTKIIYQNIVKNIESEFGVIFEHELYSKIVYKNVNNYIAIGEKDIKQKGSSFITKPLIGNSNDFLVVPKCLNLYFVKGIKPELVLTKENWQEHFHIYDFCASYKIAKKYTVLLNNQKQQQLNRFFVSKKGYYLYKQKKGKNVENVLKGWGVELLNRYDENRTEYNIDFRFYLIKVNDIIQELETKQISLLQEKLF